VSVLKPAQKQIQLKRVQTHKNETLSRHNENNTA